MSIDIREAFEIDESNFSELKSVKGHTSIELCNNSNIAINARELYDHLLNIDGICEVDSLMIGWSSQQNNVEIIKAFPNLQSLSIYGHRIESLDGLECFKGKHIVIDTDNRKRNIEKIAMVPIKSMYLEYTRKEDFDAIKRCASLNSLTLGKCPNLDFYEWRNVPLEHIKFWNYCKITELRDMSYIETLARLMVGACRKFERFAGDNSNIKSIIVDGCRLFDMDSLTALPNAEYITIVACAKEIALSELPEHPAIRRLALWGCKVKIDTYDLKKKMPNLKKLSIANIKKTDKELLKQANMDESLFDDFFV